MEFGDWGLGIGDWVCTTRPNGISLKNEATA